MLPTSSYELTAINNVIISTATYSFHIMGTCLWTNKSATLHMYVPLYCYSSLHIDSTLLLIQVQKSTNHNFSLRFYCYIYARKKKPLKCHICQLVHVYLWGNYFVYTSYELTRINNVTTNPGIHNFRFLAYAPEQTCLTDHICMSNGTNTAVYM